jgi:O-acetyl-ADP-ribose deacetylase (regulator of RNase III)
VADTHTIAPATADGITIGRTVIRLVRGDITALDVEAFVFYARPDLALGSGFGSAIARRGGGEIQKALSAIGSAAVTEAVVTTAGSLKASRIVHAVGPAFQEPDLEAKLRLTVLNALARAEEQGIGQLAFPVMGAGFYGVPLTVSVDITVSALEHYLSNSTRLREVVLCANDRREHSAFESRLAAMNQASR